MVKLKQFAFLVKLRITLCLLDILIHISLLEQVKWQKVSKGLDGLTLIIIVSSLKITCTTLYSQTMGKKNLNYIQIQGADKTIHTRPGRRGNNKNAWKTIFMITDKTIYFCLLPFSSSNE